MQFRGSCFRVSSLRPRCDKKVVHGLFSVASTKLSSNGFRSLVTETYYSYPFPLLFQPRFPPMFQASSLTYTPITAAGETPEDFAPQASEVKPEQGRRSRCAKGTAPTAKGVLDGSSGATRWQRLVPHNSNRLVDAGEERVGVVLFDAPFIRLLVFVCRKSSISFA